MQQEKPASKLLVTGVVLFYLFAALAMVIANKWVLNATTTPLFFLWVQCAIASLLFLLGDAFRLFPDRLTFNWPTAKAMLPVTILSVLSLSFSNYTLQYVDASFYQIARGLVLPFTVATSLFILHSRPSLPVLFACLVVTAGFFVGVFLDAVPVSMIGVSFGVASSAITALHSVVIKGINNSSLALGWYMNAGSTLLLLPILLLAGEAPGILSLLFYSRGGIDDSNPGRLNGLQTFVYGSLITGVLGFLMCVSSLLSIKVTSPITHMVSSAVRGVAASLLGLYVFHDIITTGRATSIAVILSGSALYTWFKHQESQAQQATTPPNSRLPTSSATASRRGSYERVPNMEMSDISSDIEKGGEVDRQWERKR
ncbi:hypothetical protein BKA70DRAFT_1373987 [Coprinopsis sp. MPI-PUGE-AT-0042]|nr:hypothetical protein BKA70DRAFT_1373987 [Coprinopsis sp. MPI-PUGE-AT-0042]